MRSLILKVFVSLVSISFAILYASKHFYRDPGSVFFDKTRAYEQRYSLHRKAEVQRAIDSYTTSGAQREQHRGNASLCVAVSSVKRDHTQYLEKTTIASLLHRLSPQERQDVYISVLIANTDPEIHPSWHQPWLHQAVDEVNSYVNINASEKRYLQRLEEMGEFAEKGVLDYVQALRFCYQSGAPYIAMLEDDILMAHGWLVRTLMGLRDMPPAYDFYNAWLFMRLFNQERSIGWASHSIGGNNEHWIIIGVELGVVLPLLLIRYRWRSMRAYLDVETIAILGAILIPSLVVLFFQSGKASLLPPSPGVSNEPFGCCSQALVFQRACIPQVVDFLLEKRKGQIDILLDQLAEKADLTRYALYPVQAQHIGLDSARMTGKEEAQAIWSMAYEDLDPARLDKEHDQMMEELYASGP